MVFAPVPGSVNARVIKDTEKNGSRTRALKLWFGLISYILIKRFKKREQNEGTEKTKKDRTGVILFSSSLLCRPPVCAFSTF